MASRIISFQLSNAEGLEKIIFFEGLGYDLVIHPTIHGEPILTSQAFYYLKNLDSIAKLRINHNQENLDEYQIEYLIDNYLFEYSTNNFDSKITTKVPEPTFWRDSVHNIYHRYDQANTEALIIDKYNDSSVMSIESIDKNVDLSDWCIPKNFTMPIIDDYVKKMQALLNEKVMLMMMPSSEKDGYMGKIRIFESGDGLLDLYQAESLDNIRIDKNKDVYVINSTFSSGYDVYLPIDKVECTNLYNPLLLSYYFSGLNDKNILNSFLSFYNVLEYYFEEAPRLKGMTARTEREQLKVVLDLLTNHSGIDSFINSEDNEEKEKMANNISTSSSVHIDRLDIESSDLVSALSTWLYDIRCAIVHSKKTRRGNTTAIFEPYSSEADNVKVSLPIIRWLSILCIKKDHFLGNGRSSL